MNLASLGYALAYLGEVDRAQAAADEAVELGADIGGIQLGHGYAAMAVVALAAGDAAKAAEADALSEPLRSGQPELAAMHFELESHIALANGQHVRARMLAEKAVSSTGGRGCHSAAAFLARARIALLDGEHDRAEADAHAGLECAGPVGANLDVPELLECIAAVAAMRESHREAARVYGAAEALRGSTGRVRQPAYEVRYQASVEQLRRVMEHDDFTDAWAEGAALSVNEAIAYTRRGRGERKRPSTGWAALTPTELDVAHLVRKGLQNKEIAARLFISPRTVQTHLTHMYAKLGLSSRVQLAQEAAARDD
jgi:DNA-binding CsgD family transcriptional regulator